MYFTVRVKCMTYNHSSYIKEAMDGFCSQQTNFPFVCVIMDDASSDGEQDILNNYLQENFDLDDESISYTEETANYNLIFARHKTNCNCYFAVFLLKENHYQKKSKNQYLKKEWINTKYIANCEGDDYWVDSLKLQKQVDFLESHPDYSLVFHNALFHYENGHQPDHRANDFPTGRFYNLQPNIIGKIPTASMVYRSNIYISKLFQECKNSSKIYVGDVPLTLCCDVYGKIYCFNDVMSVYRIHPTNWTNTKEKFRSYKYLFQDIELLKIFKGKYDDSFKNAIARKSIDFFLLIKEKEFKKAFILITNCLRYSPIKSIRVLFLHFSDKIKRELELI